MGDIQESPWSLVCFAHFLISAGRTSVTLYTKFEYKANNDVPILILLNDSLISYGPLMIFQFV